MLFERSKVGQSNRASFLGVDLVCYVEGGGGVSEDSEDSFFWQRVLRAMCPDKKIKFLAKGGKPVLERLAREIVRDDITGTIVAMDADYDHLDDETIKDNRVLYTYGYSWENDVFALSCMKKSVGLIAMSDKATDDQVIEFLSDGHIQVCNQLGWPIKADYLAFHSGGSILPRTNPGRVVAPQNDGRPFVKKDQVKTLCREFNTTRTARGAKINKNIGDVARHCVGHVYSLVCCYLIRATIRKIKARLSVNPVHVRNISIMSFAEYLLEDEEEQVIKHYKNVCSQI